MKIVFATGNAGKIREIKDILNDVDAEVFSLKELGLKSEAEENGESFGDNAFIKANEIYERLSAEGKMKDTIVMADDSGLCIDYLGGEPGVHSARFMGHDTPYSIKNAVILEKLEGVPDEKRGAQFVCHICAIGEDGVRFDAEDEMPGMIAHESRGAEGFGYDPIFYLPEKKKTSGELSEEEKNEISHRGKVLRSMKKLLCSKRRLKLK